MLAGYKLTAGRAKTNNQIDGDQSMGGDAVQVSRGITLIELVVAIAILAVIVALAAPSMTGLIQNNRAAAGANELVTALNLTRSEALKRTRDVEICASDDQASCSGNWRDGWIVRTSGDNQLIQVWSSPTGDAQFLVDVGDTNGLPAIIVFEPSGRTDLENTVAFQLRLPNCTRDSNRDIRLVPTGRVSVQRQLCGEEE